MGGGGCCGAGSLDCTGNQGDSTTRGSLQTIFGLSYSRRGTVSVAGSDVWAAGAIENPARLASIQITLATHHVSRGPLRYWHRPVQPSAITVEVRHAVVAPPPSTNHHSEFLAVGLHTDSFAIDALESKGDIQWPFLFHSASKAFRIQRDAWLKSHPSAMPDPRLRDDIGRPLFFVEVPPYWFLALVNDVHSLGTCSQTLQMSDQ